MSGGWDWVVSSLIIGGLILTIWAKVSKRTIPELIGGIDAEVDIGNDTKLLVNAAGPDFTFNAIMTSKGISLKHVLSNFFDETELPIPNYELIELGFEFIKSAN